MFAYANRRWRILVMDTTIHGVKEIDSAPNPFSKTLWLLVLACFSGIMFYQICHLTHHFLQEPVVIAVTTLKEKTQGKQYVFPLLLLLVPTSDLFNASPEAKAALDSSPFDRHGRFYIRSLVDSNFKAPDDHNAALGRQQFDRYLSENSNSTWHDLVSPFVANVSYWLDAGGRDFRFNIVNRTISSYMTYHFIQPIFTSSLHDDAAVDTGVKFVDATKEILLEASIDFDAMAKVGVSNHTPLLSLTSYGLATNALRLKPGNVYKISFDIVGHRRVPLRRSPCVKDKIQYQTYDYEACHEQCRFEAYHEWSPRRCYKHSFNWGFYGIFARARPCSHGVHFNGTEVAKGASLTDVEEPDYQKMPSADDLAEAQNSYQRCLREKCIDACQQMSVKFYTQNSDFKETLGATSVIYMSWPGPGAVPVYVEDLQYTWDGFVGQLGGLLGLWLGASMVSICELVYLCCFCCGRVRKTESKNNDKDEVTNGKGPSLENGNMLNNENDDRDIFSASTKV